MINLDLQYPPITVTTPATETPVSVEDAKQYCDYEDNDRNGQFRAWILAATAQVEHDCEVMLCSQTAKLYLPWFPECIEISRIPVTSISSITYVDGNGDTQTLSSSVYQTNLDATPPRIIEAYNQSWPTTRSDTEKCVTVTFVGGFGLSSTDPRWPLYQEAVRVKVKRMYDGCGDSSDMVYDGLISALRWRPFV